MLKRYFFSCFLALGIILGTPNLLHAQDSDIPVELDETERYGVGARAVAMGLAQQAVTFDPLALTGNPAALAFLPDMNVSGGFSIRSLLSALERGSVQEDSQAMSIFDHAILALPATPELVVAFGNYAVNNPSRRLTYFAPLPGTSDRSEVDAIDLDASLRAWSAGIGWAASPEVSFGGRIEYLYGERDETLIVAHGVPVGGFDSDEFGLCYSCDGAEDTFREDIQRNLDATGFRGAVSVFAFAGENFRLGATLDFPTTLEYTGPVFIAYEDFLGPFEDERIYILDEISLPMQIGFGGAWENESITLAVDGRFSDWEQIDFEGEILGPGRMPAYRSTMDFHLGGEYRLKNRPIALRAGLMFTPLPYEFMAGATSLVFDENNPTDPNDDTSFVARDYPQAIITTDRRAISLGLGTQVTDQFSLDVAFQQSTWERETQDGSSLDRQRSTRVLLNAGYRW